MQEEEVEKDGCSELYQVYQPASICMYVKMLNRLYIMGFLLYNCIEELLRLHLHYIDTRTAAPQLRHRRCRATRRLRRWRDGNIIIHLPALP